MSEKYYNPNSKYGRKKNRERAAKNYNNYSDEEKQLYNETSFYAWLVIFIIIAFVVFFIAMCSGPEEAIRYITR